MDTEWINILLVDDRPENLDALEAILDAPDYRLVRANSGDEALRWLLQMDFAVIVMDVVMSGMDGYETVNLIKQRERSRLTPIIFVTAYGQEEARMLEGYAVGAVDYLTKPIVSSVLRSKVAVFADQYRLNARLRQLNLDLKAKNDELQHIQAELEKSRARYFDLYDLAPVGYVTLDQPGLILEANASAANLVGLPREALVQQPLAHFIVDEDQDLYNHYCQHIFESHSTPAGILPAGLLNACELRMRRQDDSIFWARLESTVVQEDGGTPGYRAVISDITPLKQAEEELRLHQEGLEAIVAERTAELAQRNRDLEEFTSMISHDLQEPLRKVKSFGDMLAKSASGRLDETELEYLHRMQDAASRMSVMIKGLLTLSRLSTRAVEFKTVDLNQVVREALSNLEASLERSGGQVEVSLLPVIDGEPLQMQQLFQNLIGNGLKFRRPGVPPLVRVMCQEMPAVGRSKPGKIKIIVEDNGIGFDETYLEKLFQPFKRLVTRTEYEGSGMGLAICKKVVERHCGEISAKSIPGNGSTFFITLPVKQG